MTKFSESEFECKLLELRETHDSISNLSSWCLGNCKSHSSIVSIWLSVMKKVPVNQRLSLFYLANDVIQYSKRQQLPFVESFAPALQKATVLVRDASVRNKILRIFKIWEDRSIYDESFLLDLTGLLMAAHRKSAELADFQPNAMFQKMRECVTLEEETDKRMLHTSRHNESIKNIDKMMKNLKGRYDLDEAKEEIDEISKGLRDYVQSLEKEIREREVLLNQLNIAQEYYEKDLGEAKVVSNAYKCFSHRVKQVQKRLKEKITSISDDNKSTKADPTIGRNTKSEKKERESESITKDPELLLDKYKSPEEMNASSDGNEDVLESSTIEALYDDSKCSSFISSFEFIESQAISSLTCTGIEDKETCCEAAAVFPVYTPSMTTGKKSNDTSNKEEITTYGAYKYTEEYFTGKTLKLEDRSVNEFMKKVEGIKYYSLDSETKKEMDGAKQNDSWTALLKQIGNAPPPPPPPPLPPPLPNESASFTSSNESMIDLGSCLESAVKTWSASEIIESLLKKSDLKPPPDPPENIQDLRKEEETTVKNKEVHFTVSCDTDVDQRNLMHLMASASTALWNLNDEKYVPPSITGSRVTQGNVVGGYASQSVQPMIDRDYREEIWEGGNPRPQTPGPMINSAVVDMELSDEDDQQQDTKDPVPQSCVVMAPPPPCTSFISDGLFLQPPPVMIHQEHRNVMMPPPPCPPLCPPCDIHTWMPPPPPPFNPPPPTYNPHQPLPIDTRRPPPNFRDARNFHLPEENFQFRW